VSQSQCGLIVLSDQLQIAGLVGHLPHQLPNLTRAHPRAINLWPLGIIRY